MKLFSCSNCGNVLYFENIRCEKCGHALGYLPDANRLLPLAADGDTLRAVAEDGGVEERYGALRRCANAAHDACNWLLPESNGSEYCESCRHNRVVPDLTTPANLQAWQRVQVAKNRLFYSVLRLDLPHPVRPKDGNAGLCFDVLADPPPGSGSHVMTGHDNGLITLALSEADDVERQRRQQAMGEPYRTLLGHMRHEIGHYYWDLLVRDGERLDECRDLFGDDRADYGAALQRYYADGPAPDWQCRLVSAYASAHPWEDFAETFGHYLHITDTLEMGRAFGVSLRPRLPTPDAAALHARIDFDPFRAENFTEIIEAWLPLTFVANNLNRCMGEADLYPFVLSQPVVEKLAFIHRLVSKGSGAAADELPRPALEVSGQMTDGGCDQARREADASALLS